MAGFKIADAYVDVDADTNRVEQGLSSLGGRFGGVGLKIGAGLVGGILAYGIADKVGSYLKSSVMGASDLNETINKSTVIFGNNAKMMLNWSENAATSLGLSQSAALSSAAGFGDMFLQIGFTGDEAAKMSKSVVQAAADLGSFSNLDTADVADRMAAAFRGEYDSLQAVIPNINAARVESEALAATGKTVASELTAQEKAAAVLAIVHADGARAMGDFANTSEGFANQLKIASAQSEDLKTKVGNALLPALGAMAGVVTSQVMPGLSLLADTYLPLVSAWMETLATKIGGMTFLEFNNGVVSLGPAFDGVIAKIQPFIDLLDVLLPIAGLLKQPFLDAGTALAETLMPALQEIIPVLGEALLTAIETLAPYLPDLADAFILVIEAVLPLIPTILELIPPLLDLITTILPPLAQLLKDHLPEAVAATTAVINFLIPIIEWLVRNLGGTLDAATALSEFFSGDMSWQDLIGKVTAAGGVVGWIAGVANTTGTAFGNFARTTGAAFGDFARSAQEKINEGVAFIRSLPDRAQNAVGNLGGLLYSAGKSVVQGFINGVEDMIGDLLATLSHLTSLIPANKGPESVDKVLLRPNGRMIMGGLIGGLKSREDELKSYLGGLTGDIGDVGISGSPSGLPAVGFEDTRGTTTTYVFEEGSFSIDMTKIRSIEDLLAMLESLTQIARAGRGKKA